MRIIYNAYVIESRPGRPVRIDNHIEQPEFDTPEKGGELQAMKHIDERNAMIRAGRHHEVKQ